MLRVVYIILLFVFSTTIRGECYDQNDPDEMFDSIGLKRNCSESSRPAAPRTESRPSRSDFGTGILYTPAGDTINPAGARAAVIVDGGISFIAGRGNTGGDNDFMIMKFFADGSLDTSFDTDGKLLASFGNTDDWAHSMALQTDGRIVVAGRSDHGSAGNFNFAILRILTTGSLDTTFNTTGKRLVDINGAASIARAVAVQTDGNVVLAGYAKNTNWDNAYCRVTTDGRLDTTFSTDGKYTVANGASDNAALSVVIDSTGKIVGGGNLYTTHWEDGIVRLLSSGNLDTSFFTNGKRTYTYLSGNEISIYGLAIDRANQIVAVGNGPTMLGDGFGIARLLTSGVMDTSFATNGKMSYALGITTDRAHAVALETTGSGIVVAGQTMDGITYSFGVIRLTSSGAIDATFNGTGKNIIDIGSGEEDVAQAIAMKGDGTIIVAGRENGPAAPNWNFAMVRLQSDGTLALSGAVVKSFGTADGYVSYDFGGNETPHDLIVDTQGRLLMSGAAIADTDYALVRLFQNGALDTSFNTNGLMVTDTGGAEIGYGIELQTDGAIVQCGQGGGVQTVVRYLTDGRLDTSFATSGVKALTAASCYSISVQTDAKLVLASDTGNDYQAVRLLTDGNLDTSFHTTGKFNVSIGAVDDTAYGILDLNGKFIVLGAVPASSNTTWIRFETSGALDTSFSTDGKDSKNLTGGGEIVPQGSRNIAVAAITGEIYTAVDESGSKNLSVARLLSSGNLDTSFATIGINTDGSSTAFFPGGIRLTPNGKVIVHADDQTNQFFKRFLSDGSYDLTFNGSGISSQVGNAQAHGLVIAPNGWLCGGSNYGNDFGIGCVWQ